MMSSKKTPKFSIPKLEFNKQDETRKRSKSLINSYNATKWGAGYKPRTTDIELWSLYCKKESLYSANVNYSAPFRYLNKEEDDEINEANNVNSKIKAKHKNNNRDEKENKKLEINNNIGFSIFKKKKTLTKISNLDEKKNKNNDNKKKNNNINNSGYVGYHRKNTDPN
eukprot:TRINITY_DN6775_c0_g1_i1.p1 TRINITY_DN6775_c0_g1~~TRINITY_DN6775_c0_g1_i1.p1  ORF type:complete len:168 (-),score=50.76 TRINITY_DN6775_c0_g1_i1:24-527(-)